MPTVTLVSLFSKNTMVQQEPRGYLCSFYENLLNTNSMLHITLDAANKTRSLSCCNYTQKSIFHYLFKVHNVTLGVFSCMHQSKVRKEVTTLGSFPSLSLK